MFNWRPRTPNSKDLVLMNPENLNKKKIEKLYNEITKYWADNWQSISQTMVTGLRNFLDSCLRKDGEIVFEYETYSKMLRWIVTQGNTKYDSPRYFLWREALKNLWIYLFGANFHQFREYLGGGKYKDNKKIWHKWLKKIGDSEDFNINSFDRDTRSRPWKKLEYLISSVLCSLKKYIRSKKKRK